MDNYVGSSTVLGTDKYTYVDKYILKYKSRDQTFVLYIQMFCFFIHMNICADRGHPQIQALWSGSLSLGYAVIIIVTSVIRQQEIS